MAVRVGVVAMVVDLGAVTADGAELVWRARRRRDFRLRRRCPNRDGVAAREAAPDCVVVGRARLGGIPMGVLEGGVDRWIAGRAEMAAE